MKKLLLITATLLSTQTSFAMLNFSIPANACVVTVRDTPFAASYIRHRGGQEFCIAETAPASTADVMGLEVHLTGTYIKALQETRKALLQELKNDPEFRKALVEELRNSGAL